LNHVSVWVDQTLVKCEWVVDNSGIYTHVFFGVFSDKQIDLKNVILKKLKVRDLKKILSDWDENCDGCIEKGDFIKRIEDLKPKYMKDEL
jgi:hypothetical protein